MPSHLCGARSGSPPKIIGEVIWIICSGWVEKLEHHATRIILPTFLRMVVRSWRYFDLVRLKKVQGHNKTTVTAWGREEGREGRPEGGDTGERRGGEAREKRESQKEGKDEKEWYFLLTVYVTRSLGDLHAKLFQGCSCAQEIQLHTRALFSMLMKLHYKFLTRKI